MHTFVINPDVRTSRARLRPERELQTLRAEVERLRLLLDEPRAALPLRPHFMETPSQNRTCDSYPKHSESFEMLETMQDKSEPHHHDRNL